MVHSSEHSNEILVPLTQRISSLAQELLVSQGLYSMKLASYYAASLQYFAGMLSGY
jgi:hypothetical protein